MKRRVMEIPRVGFLPEEVIVEPFVEELRNGWRVHRYPAQGFSTNLFELRASPKVLAEFTADEKDVAVAFAEDYSEIRRKNREWLANQEKMVID